MRTGGVVSSPARESGRMGLLKTTVTSLASLVLAAPARALLADPAREIG